MPTPKNNQRISEQGAVKIMTLLAELLIKQDGLEPVSIVVTKKTDDSVAS